MCEPWGCGVDGEQITREGVSGGAPDLFERWLCERSTRLAEPSGMTTALPCGLDGRRALGVSCAAVGRAGHASPGGGFVNPPCGWDVSVQLPAGAMPPDGRSPPFAFLPFFGTFTEQSAAGAVLLRFFRAAVFPTLACAILAARSDLISASISLARSAASVADGTRVSVS